MLLRNRQKPDDEHLIPHLWTWHGSARKQDGPAKNGTARYAEFSKLSAQMVELSLQEAQRERNLRGASPKNPSTFSSPLVWPTDLQNITRPATESLERPGTARKSAVAFNAVNPPQTHGTPRELRFPDFAVLYSRARIILQGMANCWNEVPPRMHSLRGRLRVAGSDAFASMRGRWKSVQNDQRLAAVRERILRRLTIAAQRMQLICQRTALLIGCWSRWTATITQFLAAQISANLTMVSHSQPLQHVRHACQKKFRALTTRAPVVWAVMNKFAVLTRRATSGRHLDHK